MKIFFGFFNPFFLCVLDKGYNSREAKIQTAKNMLKMKLGSIEQIAQVSGLSIKEVEELAGK
ncbi:MAG: hypothetical protein K6D58_01090 [Treponema sp.]|nr:hypothetical protein [Treponema sp.]